METSRSLTAATASAAEAGSSRSASSPRARSISAPARSSSARSSVATAPSPLIADSAIQRACLPASRRSAGPEPAARSFSSAGSLRSPFSRPSAQIARASSAVRARARSRRRSNQSTVEGRETPGVRRYASRSSAPPAPTAARSRAISPAPVTVRGADRSAWTTAGIPYRASTLPNRGPAEAGSRSTIAISPGGTPSWSRRATSPPTASASASSPAEASRARPPSFSTGSSSPVASPKRRSSSNRVELPVKRATDSS